MTGRVEARGQPHTCRKSPPAASCRTLRPPAARSRKSPPAASCRTLRPPATRTSCRCNPPAESSPEFSRSSPPLRPPRSPPRSSPRRTAPARRRVLPGVLPRGTGVLPRAIESSPEFSRAAPAFGGSVVPIAVSFDRRRACDANGQNPAGEGGIAAGVEFCGWDRCSARRADPRGARGRVRSPAARPRTRAEPHPPPHELGRGLRPHELEQLERDSHACILQRVRHRPPACSPARTLCNRVSRTRRWSDHISAPEGGKLRGRGPRAGICFANGNGGPPLRRPELLPGTGRSSGRRSR